MTERECPPNDRTAEALCESLWEVLDRCEALLEEHGDCECGLCEDAAGLRYNVQMALSCFECALIPWPAFCRRHGLRTVDADEPLYAECVA